MSLIEDIEENSNKNIFGEPFYKLCNYPVLYKQIRHRTNDFKLAEHTSMSLYLGDMSVSHILNSHPDQGR